MDLKEKLELPIPKEAIYQRQGAGKMLDYVDGAYVIDSLNEVFGPIGWSWDHVEHKLVSLTALEGDDAGKWLALCTYVGTLSISDPQKDHQSVYKSGEAAGSGKSTDPNQALHFALTEASTDALKRAARLLGGRMGLELYRAKQGGKNISQMPLDPEQASDAYRMFSEGIAKAKDKDTISVLANEIKAGADKCSPRELDELRSQMRAKMKEIT